MKKLTTLLLSLGLVGGLNAAITTGPISLANASFEDGASAQIDSWFEENDAGGSSGNDNFAEVRQLDTSNTNVPLTSDGDYWLNLATRSETSFSAAVYQSLGTWETGNPLSYDLSALLGDRSNQDFGTVTFALWASETGTSGADGTALSALTGAGLLDSSTFDFTESGASTAATGTFTLDATGIADTDILWLRISASGAEGNQHLVDSISVTAVPEPSTYALIGGFAALGLAMLRRRLRS